MIPSRPPTLDTLTIDPLAALEHARQHGQRQTHRCEEVHPHDRFDLGRVQRGDGPALRHCGVVDQHIDAAERIPRLAAPAGRPPRVSARSATHISRRARNPGSPPAPRRAGRADGRSGRRWPPVGEGASQRGTHTGRRAGDEHPFARRRERHGSRLARVASYDTRFGDIRAISGRSTLEAVVAEPERADAGQRSLGLAEHPCHRTAEQRAHRLRQRRRGGLRRRLGPQQVHQRRARIARRGGRRRRARARPAPWRG